jgi:tetratricopeptide (TPR) repeat protein
LSKYATQAFLKRAHELKDEGNKCFQAKEYAAALEKYEQALKLAPEGHADRAVFHRSPTYITSQYCSNSVNMSRCS